jgi:hypothetical protein
MITAFAFIAALVSGVGAPRPAPVAVTHSDRITGTAELAKFIAGVRRTPTFARQMKLSCNVCHLGGFPQLTRFGRLFKLNGYTLSGLPQIVEQLDSVSRKTLSLSPIPGLSMMAIIDVTNIAKPLPGAATTTADYPQQLSLFYGGEIAPKLGALAQVTYSDVTGRISIDNTDVRFADHTKLGGRDVLYGITLHNNPTVQDVWNSASAWSYPFVSPSFAPRPMASPLVSGGLAQSVLGLGAYALYDNTLYAEVSGYMAAPQGSRAAGDSASLNTMHNVAPYWRVALQNRNGPVYLMIGTFGLVADVYPGAVGGATNRYADIGLDAQAEREVGQGSLVVRASWTHEHQDLGASFTAAPKLSEHATNTLDSFRANAAYSPNRFCAFTLGLFNTTGTSDNRLYASAAATGSSTGSPESNGATGEFSVSPWLNVRLGAQYVMYQKFNGASRSYDVASIGRNAKDNNTLMLYTWFAF